MKDMSKENKNLPAFPPNAGWEHSEAIGLTKREYIAAKAMQALIASGCIGGASVAMESVKYADALLAELEK